VYAIWYQFTLVVIAASSFFMYSRGGGVVEAGTGEGAAVSNHIFGAYVLSGAVVSESTSCNIRMHERV
jgi:hypothetical protein